MAQKITGGARQFWADEIGREFDATIAPYDEPADRRDMTFSVEANIDCPDGYRVTDVDYDAVNRSITIFYNPA